MSKEWNEAGGEFLETKEMHECRDEYASLPKEIAEPEAEYPAMKELFGETFREAEENTGKSEADKKQRQKRKKLVHKMAYMVASAVAVVTLSQTLDQEPENNWENIQIEEETNGQTENFVWPTVPGFEPDEQVDGYDSNQDHVISNKLAESSKVFEDMLYIGYDRFTRSTHDVIPFEKDDLWGIIDYQGNVILEPVYEGCWDVAAREDNVDKYIVFYDDENYYIVNKEGKLRNTYQKRVVNGIEIGSNDIISYAVSDDGYMGTKVIYETVGGARVIATFTNVVDWLEFRDGKAFVVRREKEGNYKLIEVLPNGSSKVIASSVEYPHYASIEYYSGGYLGCAGITEDTSALVNPDTMEVVGELKVGVSIRNYPQIDWASWYKERNGGSDRLPDDFDNYRYTYGTFGMAYYDKNDAESNHYQTYAVKQVTLPDGVSKSYLVQYTNKYLTGEWAEWQDGFIFEFDEIFLDDHPYLAVRDGEEWKYVDFSGNVVSDTYALATSFNDEGYALVVDEENMGYIIDSNFKKLKEIPNVKTAQAMRDMFYIECEFDYDSEWQDGVYLYYFHE